MAHDTWAEAYADILSPEQMAYMLDLFYQPTALTRQMTEQGHQFVIAYDGEEPIGFASYSPKSKEQPQTYRLHKIYIMPGQQCKGVGKVLLQYIINDIQPRGASILELNVNRHNKARFFYEKMGFSVSGEEDIDIGNGYFMNDYIMSKAIIGENF